MANKDPRATIEGAELLGTSPAKLAALIHQGRVDVPRNARGPLWFRESLQAAARILGITDLSILNRLNEVAMHDPPRRELRRKFCGYSVRERNGEARRYRIASHALDLAARFKRAGTLDGVSSIYEVKDSKTEQIVRVERIPWADAATCPAHPAASFTELVEE